MGPVLTIIESLDAVLAHPIVLLTWTEERYRWNLEEYPHWAQEEISGTSSLDSRLKRYSIQPNTSYCSAETPQAADSQPYVALRATYDEYQH